MWKQITAFLFFSVFVTKAVHVDKCKEIFGAKDGSYGSAKIEDVRVSECSDVPCKLRKGQTYTIEFDFVAEYGIFMLDKTYKSLTTAVFGGIGIIKVPFRGVHAANGCKDITLKGTKKRGCPLEEGNTYTYKNSFPILKSYPAVNVQVQYGLNDGKKSIVCFNLPAKIANA